MNFSCSGKKSTKRSRHKGNCVSRSRAPNPSPLCIPRRYYDTALHLNDVTAAAAQPNYFYQHCNGGRFSNGLYAHRFCKSIPERFTDAQRPEGGSDASAARGGYSELSEWQWSKFRERTANRKFREPQQEHRMSAPPIAVPEKIIGLTLPPRFFRPLLLAQLASSATGSARIAPPYTDFFGYFLVRRQESNTTPRRTAAPVQKSVTNR